MITIDEGAEWGGPKPGKAAQKVFELRLEEG